ncbi:MAG: AmmeMemoRadiSam system protein B [Acidobacteria bacterium]|nr:AmmeMemoRadiSam system protein B [Acidobacteriota bacterium]
MNKMIIALILITGLLGILPIHGETVRKSALSGSWYPSDAKVLKTALTKLYESIPESKSGKEIKGLILPHASYYYSGKAAVTAYSLIKHQKIRRIIILAPTHTQYIRGASVPEYDYYETPLGKVPMDNEVIKKLRSSGLFQNVQSAHTQEHSIEIQLPLLQMILKDFKIVPILIGQADAKDANKLADALKPFINNETLVIASSDFTHHGSRFGYEPFKTDQKDKLNNLDHNAFKYIEKMDAEGFLNYVNISGATICGARPITVLIDLMKPAEVKEITYYTSGDVTGDWDSSVSYLAAVFYPGKEGNKPEKKNVKKKEKGNDMSVMLNQEEKVTLLKLARETLELWVKEERIPDDVESRYNITDTLKLETGVFVTLKMRGNLRGCIGFVTGREPTYKAVMANAVNASTHDPRFSHVTPNELNKIDIEISVMTPLEKVKDVSEIEVGKHGLVMKKGYNSGLLLPQVPVEWKWTRDEFLTQTCRKAGLSGNCWKDKDTEILKFSAQVFGEKE